jgi:hypothetical protein
MKRSLLPTVLACLLSTTSFACLSSSSSSGPPANADAGPLGPDSGVGCSSQVLDRCTLPNGTCMEYSGPPSTTGDPFDCPNLGGTYTNAAACVRTGTVGSCVAPSGITGIDGKPCQYFITTWLPDGYDSGTPGQECTGLFGTFVPN